MPRCRIRSRYKCAQALRCPIVVEEARPVDVMSPLNTMNSVHNDDRIAPRINLFLSAILACNGRRIPVRIRDISASGARVDGGNLPEPGTAIEIIRADKTLTGQTIWKQQNRCGIRFDTEIDLAQWTPTKSSQKQANVDEAIASIRGAQPQQVPAAEAPQVCDKRLAEEILLAKRNVCIALDELSEYPILIHRAPLTLQRLERVANTLMHLNAILASNDRAGALHEIGMTDLVRRLTR